MKNFLNLSADKFLVSIDRGPRFIGGHFLKDPSRAAPLALAKSINYTYHSKQVAPGGC